MALRETACYLWLLVYFFVLMTNPRLNSPHHPLVFMKTNIFRNIKNQVSLKGIACYMWLSGYFSRWSRIRGEICPINLQSSEKRSRISIIIKTQIALRGIACYICIWIARYLFALMTNPRLDLPQHPLVFRKTLKDRQNHKGLDRPERDGVLFITFGVYFHADDESVVRLASSPFSLQ